MCCIVLKMLFNAFSGLHYHVITYIRQSSDDNSFLDLVKVMPIILRLRYLLRFKTYNDGKFKYICTWNNDGNCMRGCINQNLIYKMNEIINQFFPVIMTPFVSLNCKVSQEIVILRNCNFYFFCSCLFLQKIWMEMRITVSDMQYNNKKKKNNKTKHYEIHCLLIFIFSHLSKILKYTQTTQHYKAAIPGCLIIL